MKEDQLADEVRKLKRKLSELEGKKAGEPRGVKCYSCGRHGHIARDCRKRKSKRISDGGEDKVSKTKSGKGSQN